MEMEKAMAAHSSVLACRIPGTGEPGGLPSVGHTESGTAERLSSSGDSIHILSESFPGGSDGDKPACSAGDPGWIPGQEDPPEKGTATHSSILA